MRSARQYGDLTRRRILWQDVVVVTNPAFIAQIMNDREHFPNRPHTGIADLVPLGLLCADGARMARGRSVPAWGAVLA